MIANIINSICSSILGGTIVYLVVKNNSEFKEIDNDKLKDLYQDYFDPDAILIN